MTANLDSIVETLSKMTVLELNDLRKKLEETWDVKAAAPMMAMAMPSGPAAGADAAAGPQKDHFDVMITNLGESKKIDVIKAVREVATALSTMEVNNLLNTLPAKVLEGADKAKAEEMKAKLSALGVTIELK